jgi:hypothetical protein
MRELSDLEGMVQDCIVGMAATAEAYPEIARHLTRIAGLLWSAKDDLERLRQVSQPLVPVAS